jgi:hypothetical protein
MLKLSSYIELTLKYDPPRGFIDHTAPHWLDQNHHIPIQIILSSQKEDSRPLITVSTTVMTVIHFVKVSIMYPRVVILSLAKRLEKPSFCHSYTSSAA